MERKHYTEEFKCSTLEMAAKGAVSIAQLERDLGITAGLIYKWRDRYRVEASELKPSEEREAQAEIRRLKRELAIAREERDILKKAIQVFSQDRQR
jgi:transposase